MCATLQKSSNANAKLRRSSCEGDNNSSLAVPPCLYAISLLFTAVCSSLLCSPLPRWSIPPHPHQQPLFSRPSAAAVSPSSPTQHHHILIRRICIAVQDVNQCSLRLASHLVLPGRCWMLAESRPIQHRSESHSHTNASQPAHGCILGRISAAPSLLRGGLFLFSSLISFSFRTFEMLVARCLLLSCILWTDMLRATAIYYYILSYTLYSSLPVRF